MKQLPTVPPHALASGTGRLLVVDDNSVNLMVLEHLLAGLGYTVATTSSGVEALEHLEGPGGADFAAVLMDCHMPVLDGFDTTRFIRARERDLGLPRLPVLAVTASADRRDEEQAVDAGMDRYLVKPVTRAVVAEALDQLLGAAGDGAVVTQDAAPDMGARRREELLAIGGEELLRTVRTVFVRDAPACLVALRDALEHADPEALASAAHALKGASLNAGISRVARATGKLEQMGKQGTMSGAQALVDDVEEALGEVVAEYAPA